MAEQCVARFSVRVVQAVNLGTHILYIGEVEEAEKLCAGDPMTYAYYHLVKAARRRRRHRATCPTRPMRRRAAAAAAGEGDAEAPKPKYAWRCKVCGHIEYGDELPDDFTCPVCSVGPDMFERIEL